QKMRPLAGSSAAAGKRPRITMLAVRLTQCTSKLGKASHPPAAVLGWLGGIAINSFPQCSTGLHHRAYLASCSLRRCWFSVVQLKVAILRIAVTLRRCSRSILQKLSPRAADLLNRATLGLNSTLA